MVNKFQKKSADPSDARTIEDPAEIGAVDQTNDVPESSEPEAEPQPTQRTPQITLQSRTVASKRPLVQSNPKELRTIRVKTQQGVVVRINAADFDPELHEPETPEDEKWGKATLEARQKAAEEQERQDYVKRLVRGQTS